MNFGKILNKEKLQKEYWDNKKSADEIGSEVGCVGRIVLRWMERYNVPRRKPGERANGEFTLKEGESGYWKGKHFSQKYRQKISDGHKGQIPWNKGRFGLWKHTEEWKRERSEALSGEGHPMYGKYHTDKARNNMSKSHIGIQAGKNHPNWKGGVTPLRIKVRHSFLYRQWRSDVFTRDDFTCQKCNRRGGKLHSHHIKSFALIFELNDITTFEQAMECSELWDINNGITYCMKCHFDKKEADCDVSTNEILDFRFL